MAGENEKPITRRGFLGGLLRGAGAIGLAGGAAAIVGKIASADDMVWQIDPNKCIQCGYCATKCVLNPSAVKCVNFFRVCGRCKLCFGYFDPQSADYNTGAEDMICPTDAIKRTFIRDPYYEYTLDEAACIGCGKCVKLCQARGNGSLFLQIRHDRCRNCNQCAIATACPSGAVVRVPASSPYLYKKDWGTPGKEGGK